MKMSYLFFVFLCGIVKICFRGLNGQKLHSLLHIVQSPRSEGFLVRGFLKKQTNIHVKKKKNNVNKINFSVLPPPRRPFPEGSFFLL